MMSCLESERGHPFARARAPQEAVARTWPAEMISEEVGFPLRSSGRTLDRGGRSVKEARSPPLASPVVATCRPALVCTRSAALPRHRCSAIAAWDFAIRRSFSGTIVRNGSTGIGLTQRASQARRHRPLCRSDRRRQEPVLLPDLLEERLRRLTVSRLVVDDLPCQALFYGVRELRRFLDLRR